MAEVGQDVVWKQCAKLPGLGKAVPGKQARQGKGLEDVPGRGRKHGSGSGQLQNPEDSRRAAAPQSTTDDAKADDGRRLFRVPTLLVSLFGA